MQERQERSWSQVEIQQKNPHEWIGGVLEKDIFSGLNKSTKKIYQPSVCRCRLMIIVLKIQSQNKEIIYFHFT